MISGHLILVSIITHRGGEERSEAMSEDMRQTRNYCQKYNQTYLYTQVTVTDTSSTPSKD